MEFERPILHFGFHLVSSILSSFSSFGLKSAKIWEHSTPFSQHPEMVEHIINRIPLFPAEERIQDTLLLRRCISHPSKDASAIQNRPRKHQFCTIGWENFYFAEQRCIREKHPDKTFVLWKLFLGNLSSYSQAPSGNSCSKRKTVRKNSYKTCFL